MSLEATVDLRPGIKGPYRLRAEEYMRKGQLNDHFDDRQAAEVTGRMGDNGATIRAVANELANEGGPYWIRQDKVWLCVNHDEFFRKTRRKRKNLGKASRRLTRHLLAIDHDKLDLSLQADHKAEQLQAMMAAEFLGETCNKQMHASGALDRLKVMQSQRVIELMKNGT